MCTTTSPVPETCSANTEVELLHSFSMLTINADGHPPRGFEQGDDHFHLRDHPGFAYNVVEFVHPACCTCNAFEVGAPGNQAAKFTLPFVKSLLG